MLAQLAEEAFDPGQGEPEIHLAVFIGATVEAVFGIARDVEEGAGSDRDFFVADEEGELAED